LGTVLHAGGSTAYCHDRFGHVTRSYSDANRMSAVKQSGAVVESYTSNHRGERVLRAPVSTDAQVTVYDEAGQWIGNYGAAGQPLQQAIWWTTIRLR
jgi:hypothetical protein